MNRNHFFVASFFFLFFLQEHGMEYSGKCAHRFQTRLKWKFNGDIGV